MRTLLVVELEIAGEALPSLTGAAVGVQVHLLLFDGAPEALGEDIVQGAAFSFPWKYWMLRPISRTPPAAIRPTVNIASSPQCLRASPMMAAPAWLPMHSIARYQA